MTNKILFILFMLSFAPVNQGIVPITTIADGYVVIEVLVQCQIGKPDVRFKMLLSTTSDKTWLMDRTTQTMLQSVNPDGTNALLGEQAHRFNAFIRNFHRPKCTLGNIDDVVNELFTYGDYKARIYYKMFNNQTISIRNNEVAGIVMQMNIIADLAFVDQYLLLVPVGQTHKHIQFNGVLGVAPGATSFVQSLRNQAMPMIAIAVFEANKTTDKNPWGTEFVPCITIGQPTYQNLPPLEQLPGPILPLPPGSIERRIEVLEGMNVWKILIASVKVFYEHLGETPVVEGPERNWSEGYIDTSTEFLMYPDNINVEEFFFPDRLTAPKKEMLKKLFTQGYQETQEIEFFKNLMPSLRFHFTFPGYPQPLLVTIHGNDLLKIVKPPLLKRDFKAINLLTNSGNNQWRFGLSFLKKFYVELHFGSPASIRLVAHYDAN